MKRTFAVFGLAAALFTLALPPLPADAASQLMCNASRPGVAGASRWRATASGTTYSLNARGCALIVAADIGDAIADGFVLQAPFGSVTKAAITTSVGATNKVILPAGAYITKIIIEETSNSSTSPVGFLTIGSTNMGKDICCNNNAVAITKNAVNEISAGAMIKTLFSRTLPTDVFIDHSGGWGSGSADVTVIFGYF